MAAATFERLRNLTQTQYEQLLSKLAWALRTHRRFIEICGEKQLQDGTIIYRVKSKGYYYQITFNGDKLVNVAYEV